LRIRLYRLLGRACVYRAGAYFYRMIETDDMLPEHISDIVQMALSDHVSFDDIKEQYGLSENQVKGLMRATLKTGSYKAWRKRVRTFGDRRAVYK
jgi:uncharacterized protein (TIGR03643 family)